MHQLEYDPNTVLWSFDKRDIDEEDMKKEGEVKLDGEKTSMDQEGVGKEMEVESDGNRQ